MAFVVLAASIVFILVAIVVLKLHPFLALILAAVLVGLLSPVSLGDGAPQAVLALELTAAGFGQTAAGIGIVIVLAAIIGQCLMESGAADRIVSALLKWFGERRADASLMGSGYLLSVPVFFDTVFFLLVPIARTLWARTRAHYVIYVMAISGGAVITHSVVPPTPGPLVMTEALGLDLGVAIVGGLLLGLLPAGVALVLAHAIDARLTIEPDAMATEEKEPATPPRLPGLAASLLPVLLPVVLITGHSVVDLLARRSPGTWGGLLPWTAFFGNKNLALLLAAFAAAWVLKRGQNLGLAELSRRLEPAVTSAGVIILITCAGGAFGSMLARIGIADGLRGLTGAGSGLGILFVAFATSAVMKTAQGSGTVAMITTSGIMAAILPGAEALPFHLLYVYAAIGFGSVVISWMNDSGFWVVCKMSGFTEKETLGTWTFMLVVIGVVGFGEVLVLSQLLPLV